MAEHDLYLARQPVTASGTDYDEGFRLLRFVRACRRYRWMVIALFLTSVLTALVVAIVSPEIYQARVVMIPKHDTRPTGLGALAGEFGGLAAQLGLGGAPADDTQEALATLQSRTFVDSFIEDYNLLPILFYDIWDAKNSRWLVEEDSEIPSVADGYEEFKDIMAVSDDPQTGLVNLTIEWRDRERVAEWANALVERANRVLRERAISEAERSNQFLSEQLESASVVELRASIFSLIETNIQTIMLANVRDQYAFKIIDPAVTPEAGRFVRPKRLLLLVIGVVFGAFLAGMAVLVRLSLTTSR